MGDFRERFRLGEKVLHSLEDFRRSRRTVFYPKTDFYAGLEPPRRRGKEEEHSVAQAVADACAKFFGERPASVALMEGAGTFHDLYRVAMADGGACVCRVSLMGDARPAYELLIDGWAGEILNEKSVPAAQVWLVDLSREACPFDYELMAEASGRPLKSFEDAETQHTPPHLLSELGRHAATVHEVKTEGFGLLDVKPVVAGDDVRGCGLLSTWREYVRLNLDEHIRDCLDAGAISGAEAARIVRAFESASSLLNDAPSRLLHGDLGAHNVFADGERITALIDWEDALCGDPIFDVAYWGTFVRDAMRESFLEGYASVRPLPSDFERRYWLYYLRIALSKTVHRRRFGSADPPGRPPASLRIQKGLDRFEALG